MLSKRLTMHNILFKHNNWQLSLIRTTTHRSISHISSAPLRIIGVETSCDDTGVAIFEEGKGFIAERLASQHHVHSEFGGVVPPLAARQHKHVLPKLLELALLDSLAINDIHQNSKNLNKTDTFIESSTNYTCPEIDKVLLSPLAEKGIASITAIAVTIGPGLSPCLRTGISAAKALSKQYNIPIIPVNHLEAHSLVVRSENHVPFPFLVLLVSGGHTQLLLANDIDDFTLLGGTLDDSVGECFDKVARMLKLDTSEEHGGAVLESTSHLGDPLKYKLPIPMRKYKNCDFSFSGMKSAVRNIIQTVACGSDNGEDYSLTEEEVADIAASFQKASFTHLIERTRRAIEWCNSNGTDTKNNVKGTIKHLVVSGGVAKNNILRSALKELTSSYHMECFFPSMRLCTDNGAMVAWAGYERFKKGLSVPPEQVDELKVIPRFPLDTSFIPGVHFPSSPLARSGSGVHKSAVLKE